MEGPRIDRFFNVTEASWYLFRLCGFSDLRTSFKWFDPETSETDQVDEGKNTSVRYVLEYELFDPVDGSDQISNWRVVDLSWDNALIQLANLVHAHFDCRELV